MFGLAKLHRKSVQRNENPNGVLESPKSKPKATDPRTTSTDPRSTTTTTTSISDNNQICSPATSRRSRVSFSAADNVTISNPSIFPESSNSATCRCEEDFNDSLWVSSSPKLNSNYKRRNSAPNSHETKKDQEVNRGFGSRSCSMGEVSDSRSDKRLVMALYDFRARTDDDLGFSKGDYLEVLKYPYSDWWLAVDVHGGSGYVPSNYVAEVENVDTEPWYFGNVTRNEADILLLMPSNSQGSFLIRDSESRHMEYSLSVRYENSVKHYRIKYSEKGWFYISLQKQFPTLKNLVEYYHLHLSGMCCKFEAPCRQLVMPESEELSYNILDTWEIQRNQIELTKQLGTGNFGEVYKGVWNKTTEIAVKTLKRGTTTEREFLAEAQMMKKLRHPKLIQLYGVCSDCEPFYIITEFMKYGSLDKYLGVYRHTINLMDKLSISAQVASGMAYLESENFIHRDLAARNVLVGEGLTCKVADFGLSRILQGDEYFALEGTRFPIKWTAPEALFYNTFSIKSDVWSYGVLLVEVFTYGAVPYPELTNQQVVKKISDGYRMNRPQNCPKEIYTLMLKCWDIDPHLRPSFDTLWQTMESFCLVLHKY